MKFSPKLIDSYRKEIEEFLEGNTNLKPWENKFILWKKEGEKYKYQNFTIPEDKIDKFQSRMGGEHLIVDIVAPTPRPALVPKEKKIEPVKVQAPKPKIIIVDAPPREENIFIERSIEFGLSSYSRDMASRIRGGLELLTRKRY